MFILITNNCYIFSLTYNEWDLYRHVFTLVLAVEEKVSKLIPINGPPLLDNAAHNNMINERISNKYIKII